MSKDDIIYRPRPFGATAAQLAELYDAQRKGKSMALATLTGAIRTEAAHNADIVSILKGLKQTYRDEEDEILRVASVAKSHPDRYIRDEHIDALIAQYGGEE